MLRPNARAGGTTRGPAVALSSVQTRCHGKHRRWRYEPNAQRRRGGDLETSALKLRLGSSDGDPRYGAAADAPAAEARRPADRGHVAPVERTSRLRAGGVRRPGLSVACRL